MKTVAASAFQLDEVSDTEYERLTAIRWAASVAERICWLLQQWDDVLAVFPDAVLTSYLETMREWLNKQKDAGFRLYRSNRQH